MPYRTFYQIVIWRADGELDHSLDFLSNEWDSFVEAAADIHDRNISVAQWKDGKPQALDLDILIAERRADLACEEAHERGLRSLYSPEARG